MKKTILLVIAVLLSLTSIAQEKENIAKLKELFLQGKQLYESENFEEALPFFNEVTLKIEEDFGKEHPSYATALYYLASCHVELGNNEEALRLTTDYLPIKEKLVGKVHPEYLNFLNELARSTSELGHYKKAVEYSKEALIITEKLHSKKSADYTIALTDLAYYYAKLGDYNEAIKLEEESLTIKEDLLGKGDPDYATSLNNLSMYYSNLGDFSNGLKLSQEALELRENLYGKESVEYAIALNSVASNYFDLGDYAKAIKLSTQVLEIIEKKLGKEDPYYANALNNLAYYYSDLGNYAESIRLGTEAMRVWENNYGKEHPDYAMALNNMAAYYSKEGNISQAIKLGEEALQIMENTVGRNHPSYAFSLNNLAYYYFASDDHWRQAIERGKEALQLLEKTIGKYNPNYANSLNNYAVYCSFAGDDQAAIDLGVEAMHIRETLFGRDHTSYLQSCRNLAHCCSSSDDSIGVKNYMSQFFDIAPRVIKNNFESFTEKEREDFWNEFSTVFMEEIHRYSYFYPQPHIVEMGCDALLMGKGLLLSTSQELRALVAESGDSKAAALLENINMIRRVLRKQYEKPIAERTMNTDSLERVTANMERQLLERSKEFGDYTHNMDIRWKNVQSALSVKDAAVEFVSIPLSKRHIVYAAYVVRPGKLLPVFIPLCYEYELMEAAKNAYSTPELSKLIWGNLADELKGVNNIYFSPSGELHKIAIESLPHWNGGGKIMSECFNIYRLSSTRELALKHNNVASAGAVLYGDIDFDNAATPKKEMEISRKKHERNITLGDVTRGYFDVEEAGYRGGKVWPPLGGTHLEVENVEAILKRNVLLRTDRVATETTFKNLSGEKKKILHIATHGFYWNDSTAKKMNVKQQLPFLSFNDNRQNVADAAMTRSGLLFSGANITFSGNPIPNEEDDGVLTAQEVSYLDLRGLDLVVLSACQTGLGEVGGEGVFGLQRGFKKAGAQSIIMSLWKVNDYATLAMMTEFYKAYKPEKNNKREAFLIAQKFVKEHDSDYTYSNDEDLDQKLRKTQPHWAAFILLDALEKQ